MWIVQFCFLAGGLILVIFGFFAGTAGAGVGTGFMVSGAILSGSALISNAISERKTN